MRQLLVNATLVGAGGGLGALARYGLTGASNWFWGVRFPMGTLLSNVIGCGLAGVLAWLLIERQPASGALGGGGWPRLLIVTGFLGGLTTFSSFGIETLALAKGGDARTAGLNIAANVALSLGAVWAGWGAARAAWG